MSTLRLSKRARAVVDAVIAAYEGGASYNTVSRKVGLSSTKVRSMMIEHSPGSIRSRDQQIKVRAKPQPWEEGLTLAALSLYRVGPCLDCEVEIVSETRERGQRCGLCKAARRAA